MNTNYTKSITEMKRINADNGYHFFDRDTIRFWRSKIHTSANRWGLFIESHNNFDDTAKLYTVRMFMPYGGIVTIESAEIAKTSEHFDSLEKAKMFRNRLSRAFDEAAKCWRENNVLNNIKSMHEEGYNTGIYKITNTNDDSILINTNNFDRFIAG